ncbi:MAG: M28 family peptidase [Sphingomonadales bacterium]|nr:M28 family peptidase [Sphingomonadales bacterium]MDE2568640.1 M28 family peptidase [Sphingomonadales bacterium]
MRRWRRAGLAGRAVLALAAFALVSAKPVRLPSREPDAEIETALRSAIETLASDDFDGRKPGTEGETKTLRYLVRQWFDMGLVSGTNDPGHDWFAPVELVERDPVTSRAVFMRGKRRIPASSDDIYVVTSGLRGLVGNAPVLFVGTGEGQVPPRSELAGRVAMILAGPDEGGAANSLAERQGRLLDGGAAAVLTVLDGKRTIADIAAARARAGYALAGGRGDGDLEAFVTPAFAETLLAGEAAGSLSALRAAAARPTFVPRVLHLSVSLEAANRETRVLTHNLIARLPGRRPQDGAVLVVAHWDHLGECAPSSPTDRICNGAVDNASGLAVITEAARILVRGRPLDRDVYFVATTAEEMGMLGAFAFADNPPLPLDHIVAAFNVDSDAIAAKGGPFAIVGKGMTGLDPGIERVAAAMKRRIDPGDDANSYVKRQDIWAFVQHDVPSVMVSTAYADRKRLDRFMAEDYHKPGDAYSPAMDLGGAVDDVNMLVELVREFSDAKRWPGRSAPPAN